jgi:membrane-associated phospholipid phosphatase
MSAEAAREQPTVGRGGVLAKIGDLSSLTGKDAIRLFDEQVDTWFAPYRGVPSIDAAARIISGLGDHGLVWAVSTAWRARRSGARRNRAVRALAVAGVESSVVNAGLKAFVGRPRPNPSDLRLGENVIPLREPRTSSFPSGHTLAAFCAATVLSERGDLGGNVLLFTCAGLVGVSRVHLQAHHASDVLGGVVVGTALGAVGRRFV